jgi:hypothetical protein
MRSFVLGVCLVLLSGNIAAQDDSPLKLVPLVDKKVPKVAVWFVHPPKIPFDDSAAVEEQVFEAVEGRVDAEMLSRENVQERINSSRNPDLQDCDGHELCLLRIGKALKVDQIVGAVLSGRTKHYKLVLKSFILEGKRPIQLNSVAEGSLTDLLIGGAAEAVAALFENRDQYAPVDLASLKRKPPPPAPAAKPPPPEPRPRRKTKITRVEQAVPESGVSRAAPRRKGFLERHTWSTVAAGTGLAALATGLVFGALSLDIENHWSKEVQWDPDMDARGETYATAANVLFGFAGAAAITAVILFFSVEKEPPPVSILPRATQPGLDVVVTF